MHGNRASTYMEEHSGLVYTGIMMYADMVHLRISCKCMYNTVAQIDFTYLLVLHCMSCHYVRTIHISPTSPVVAYSTAGVALLLPSPSAHAVILY